MTHWVGYAGVAAFGLAWIPQSLETIRAGRCGANLGFLILGSVGSFCLMVYAALQGDVVFTTINLLTTLGGLLNTGYKLFPRMDGRHIA